MVRLFVGSKKKATAQSRRHPSVNGPTGAFSYYASRRANVNPNQAAPAARNANKVAKKHLSVKQLNFGALGQQFGTVLLAIVLVACILSILQIDNSPRVVILNSSTPYALHTTKDYQRTVTESLRGSLLNSNKVTVNTRSVVTDLRQKFPEIYDASLVLPLVGHRPTVYVELTRPALLLRTANATIVVDSTGRALATAQSSADATDLKLPTVTDESNIQVHVGDIALSSANVTFLEDVIRQFSSQATPIDRLVLPAGKEELDVYPRGASYYVRFNLHESDSRLQAGTFFAVRHQLAKQGSAPKQYIDVRLSGRAYYL